MKASITKLLQLKGNNSIHLTWWRAGSHVEGQLPRERTQILIIGHVALRKVVLHTYFLLYFFVPIWESTSNNKIRCPTWLYAKAYRPYTTNDYFIIIERLGNQMVVSIWIQWWCWWFGSSCIIFDWDILNYAFAKIKNNEMEKSTCH